MQRTSNRGHKGEVLASEVFLCLCFISNSFALQLKRGNAVQTYIIKLLAYNLSIPQSYVHAHN